MSHALLESSKEERRMAKAKKPKVKIRDLEAKKKTVKGGSKVSLEYKK
jgi:hypothetical protein